MSAGPILYVALKATEMGRGKTIVVMLPEDGGRYLSTNPYEV